MTQHHVQYLGPNKMTAMTLSLIGPLGMILRS